MDNDWGDDDDFLSQVNGDIEVLCTQMETAALPKLSVIPSIKRLRDSTYLTPPPDNFSTSSSQHTRKRTSNSSSQFPTLKSFRQCEPVLSNRTNEYNTQKPDNNGSNIKEKPRLQTQIKATTDATQVCDLRDDGLPHLPDYNRNVILKHLGDALAKLATSVSSNCTASQEYKEGFLHLSAFVCDGDFENIFRTFVTHSNYCLNSTSSQDNRIVLLISALQALSLCLVAVPNLLENFALYLINLRILPLLEQNPNEETRADECDQMDFEDANFTDLENFASEGQSPFISSAFLVFKTTVSFLIKEIQAPSPSEDRFKSICTAIQDLFIFIDQIFFALQGKKRFKEASNVYFFLFLFEPEKQIRQTRSFQTFPSEEVIEPDKDKFLPLIWTFLINSAKDLEEDGFETLVVFLRMIKSVLKALLRLSISVKDYYDSAISQKSFNICDIFPVKPKCIALSMGVLTWNILRKYDKAIQIEDVFARDFLEFLRITKAGMGTSFVTFCPKCLTKMGRLLKSVERNVIVA